MGYIPDRPVEIAELLQTLGVDGVRWRTLFRQFPSFTLSTVTEASIHSNAVVLARTITSMVQGTVRLRVDIGGVSYNVVDVHVDNADPVVIPGPVVGIGATANQAHVVTAWQLRCTAFE